MTREVREHPLLTIGVAVGLGVVLGAMASQATAVPYRRINWLSGLASGLSDHLPGAGHRTRRTGRLANQEFQAAASRVVRAMPEVDVDQVVRRGRQWLRSKLA